MIDVAGEPRAFDAILRREPGGVLLVELETAYGERPFSYPNKYQAVRRSVEDLNQTATLTGLYDTTARAIDLGSGEVEAARARSPSSPGDDVTIVALRRP